MLIICTLHHTGRKVPRFFGAAECCTQWGEGADIDEQLQHPGLRGDDLAAAVSGPLHALSRLLVVTRAQLSPKTCVIPCASVNTTYSPSSRLSHLDAHVVFYLSHYHWTPTTRRPSTALRLSITQAQLFSMPSTLRLTVSERPKELGPRPSVRHATPPVFLSSMSYYS